MVLRKVRNFALIATLVLLSGVGGYRLGKFNNQETRNNNQKEAVDMGLFWKVWGRLEEEYLDPKAIDAKKMVYGAIGGMTQALGDPYTSFFPPAENTRSKEDLSGEFSGVGIQLGFIDKNLAVMSPLPDNPAIKAGIRAGDLIVHIKDEQKKIDKDTDGISLPEAVDMIRGKSGTVVTLTIYREKEKEPTKEFRLTRQTILVPSVSLEWVGTKKDIPRLRVNKFGEKTAAEWDKAVKEILAKNTKKGVILDLRNNPGGYLQRAVDLGSEFISDGVIVSQAGRNETENFRVNRQGRLIGQNLVILINKGSASASEILAGALREKAGARLVGENSFGKGTVQEAEDLPGGAGIHITIAKWLLPSGKNIHGEGLKPDVEVKYEVNEKDDKADNQLDKAVEVLLNGMSG